MGAPTESKTRQNGIDRHRCTPLAPATILLVEDDSAVRQVTRAVLEIGGYRVLEADGPSTAEHIASNRGTAIDLLLTDVIMPGMNGAELARRLRQLRPDLAALFMTGYAEGEVLRRATAGSQQKHVQKPFTVSGLLAQVGDALATRWNVPENSQAPQYPSY
jgi:CheY-like chemotaxis protein